LLLAVDQTASAGGKSFRLKFKVAANAKTVLLNYTKAVK